MNQKIKTSPSFWQKHFDLLKLRGALKQKEAILFMGLTLLMLLFEFFGWQGPFYKNIAPLLRSRLSAQEIRFWAQAYTAASFWILFILSPSILLYFIKERNLYELGLKKPAPNSWMPYFIAAGFMFIVLLFVCSRPSFYKFYPLYTPQRVSDWLLFESVYMLQFIAVEFFFRGPLLFLFHRYWSHAAIFMMTLPYALIHIHKPFPEALGSIVAGILLGHLALKARSIWPGVLLHMFVAFSADTLGLFYRGFF